MNLTALSASRVSLDCLFHLRFFVAFMYKRTTVKNELDVHKLLAIMFLFMIP